MQLNVWTVLWTNGKPYVYATRPASRRRVPESRFYKPRDVQRYQRMVHSYLPSARFRCLSNVEIEGVEVVPLISDMVGWWPKMELFRDDLPEGRNLYFDLDTLIVGDLTPIVDFRASFAAIRPGKGVGSDQPKPWKDQEGFWRYPRYQTSVMVWDSRYGHIFWNRFKPEHRAYYASDQDYLGGEFPYEACMPTEWFSKIHRASIRCGPMPPLKVALTMPGHNDDAAKQYPWVKQLWRDARC